MDPRSVKELSYILKIENIPSILEHGLLSHNKADKIAHATVANGSILAKRQNKKIPQGLFLFDYVNLYFNARNPTMSRILFKGISADTLCVLHIDPIVMTLTDVIISDGNAASGYVRFRPYPIGVERLDQDYLFARSWKNEEDLIEEWRHGTYMCAEVLVPQKIDRSFILGAVVSCQEARDRLHRLASSMKIDIDADLFFR